MVQSLRVVLRPSLMSPAFVHVAGLPASNIASRVLGQIRYTLLMTLKGISLPNNTEANDD